MFIIERNTIPSINSVTVEDEAYNLGLLKDLRKHPLLNTLLPEVARISISWVYLKQGECLETHSHPTASMIIITEGSGEVLGGVVGHVKAGDIVFVSANKTHGFIGGPPNGFWGLSIQFEGLGLYENLEKPRVQFEVSLKQTEETIIMLMEEQNHYLAEYTNNPLIKLLESKDAERMELKQVLLSCLQLWSNAFQRILFAKAAFCNVTEFQTLSEAHISDELGHNKMLESLSGGQVLWNPALAATSSWFIDQMLTASESEKTILMHFVLEGSAKIFHHKAKRLFPGSTHFSIHDSKDDEHFAMGYKVLQKQTSLDFTSLQKTLKQGWMMMNYMCEAIAELVLRES